jgi:hypothetical protein
VIAPRIARLTAADTAALRDVSEHGDMIFARPNELSLSERLGMADIAIEEPTH